MDFSLYTAAENSSVLNDRTSETTSYEIVRPSKTAVKSKIAADEEYDEEASDLLRDARRKKNPALTGTLIHKLMESLVSSKNTADLSGLIREICDDYQVTDPYYADVLKQVGETIRSGGYPQTGSLPQDILAELLSAEEVHCELPFCYAEEENRIIHGVIDAAYRKDGTWHIVDYKTNEDGDDLDSQYEAQLASYVSAFKAVHNKLVNQLKTFYLVGGMPAAVTEWIETNSYIECSRCFDWEIPIRMKKIWNMRLILPLKFRQKLGIK